MALIDDIKLSLRISSSATAFNIEITDLINAAKADLGLSGILDEYILDSDALIRRAITTYCKANFGYDNPDADRLQRAYDMLKNHLTMSADYAFFAVTFSVTDADTAAAIRQAEVTFNGQIKATDAAGEVVFYVRQGSSNYEYTVTAEGYSPDSDDDNLLDVTASQTVSISLTAT